MTVVISQFFSVCVAFCILCCIVLVFCCTSVFLLFRFFIYAPKKSINKIFRSISQVLDCWSVMLFSYFVYLLNSFQKHYMYDRRDSRISHFVWPLNCLIIKFIRLKAVYTNMVIQSLIIETVVTQIRKLKMGRGIRKTKLTKFSSQISGNGTTLVDHCPVYCQNWHLTVWCFCNDKLYNCY